jgi:hypothetical protein
MGKANLLFFVTSNRYIQVKKYIGLKCSYVLRLTCLFSVLSYAVRTARKFDCRLLINEIPNKQRPVCVKKELRHAVLQTNVY